MNWSNTEYYKSFGISEQLPEITLPEIAFVGHSNVGKSTLINTLCNRRKLARVSNVPGKTTTINFYKVDNKFFIADLPGYGYAKVSKSEKQRWSELINGYLNSDREPPELICSLVDIRHKPSKEDIMMINFLIDTESPFVLVLTKADKLRPMARKERMEAFKTEIPCFEDIHKIPFSSVTKEGADELREIISETVDNI